MIVETYVEIDIPVDGETTTYRFAKAGQTPRFDAIPALKSAKITPAVVNPGRDMGVRASISVSIDDFQYPLAGSQWDKGTFWGKLRAHRVSLRGLNLRLIRGEEGQDLADMDVMHYIIDDSSRRRGITIKAKDVLKMADADRAQAPNVSRGRLSADIGAGTTNITLIPTGIGDTDYPASGKINIGNSEVVEFTRSGDDMTLTRAVSNTEAEEHDADSVCQLLLEYISESPADVIYDLLLNYAGIDDAWLPVDDWRQDVNEFVGRLYSAEIAEPTGVRELINELIEQAGLVVWWDERRQIVQVTSMRPIGASHVFGTNDIMADSFSYRENSGHRISQVWTYYALRNPLARLNDWQSYKSALVSLGPSDITSQYPQPAIKKVYSRWIGTNNRPAAARLNNQLLSRYVIPPREFSFDIFKERRSFVRLGSGAQVSHWDLQDVDGNEVSAPVQVSSVVNGETTFAVKAEEMLFTEIDEGDAPDGTKLIVIDSDTLDFNLRDFYESIYTDAVSGDTVVRVNIEPDINIGASTTDNPAFDVGDWPSGAEITIHIAQSSRIEGCGGKGGDGFRNNSYPAQPGENGGTSFYTRHPVTIENEGFMYAPGGGGGGGYGSEITFVSGLGGGGGAGYVPGENGTYDGDGAVDATIDTGGDTGSLGSGWIEGGPGGDINQDGEPGDGFGGAAGGSAGTAVDGESFITYDVEGTIVGDRVN